MTTKQRPTYEAPRFSRPYELTRETAVSLFVVALILFGPLLFTLIRLGPPLPEDEAAYQVAVLLTGVLLTTSFLYVVKALLFNRRDRMNGVTPPATAMAQLRAYLAEVGGQTVFRDFIDSTAAPLTYKNLPDGVEHVRKAFLQDALVSLNSDSEEAYREQTRFEPRCHGFLAPLTLNKPSLRRKSFAAALGLMALLSLAVAGLCATRPPVLDVWFYGWAALCVFLAAVALRKRFVAPSGEDDVELTKGSLLALVIYAESRDRMPVLRWLYQHGTPFTYEDAQAFIDDTESRLSWRTDTACTTH